MQNGGFDVANMPKEGLSILLQLGEMLMRRRNHANDRTVRKDFLKLHGQFLRDQVGHFTRFTGRSFVDFNEVHEVAMGGFCMHKFHFGDVPVKQADMG